MSVPNLILDPTLKYWALLPISIAMVLFGLIRQQLNHLLSPPKRLPSLDSKYRHSQNVTRVNLFKQNHWALPSTSISSRQAQLIESLTDDSLLPPPKPSKPEQDQPAPQLDANATDMMMNLAKTQFGNMAAQYLTMGWVNYFYGGFILMKLPFPLTFKFKQMLQAGILTSDLDVRYVSSISWYFIAILGLNSVYSVFFDGDGDAGLQQTQQMTPPMMPGMGGNAQVDERKQFAEQYARECNDLRIIPGKSVLDGIDARLLKIYG